ncbi:hypothetical protein ACWGID_18385 [Kribbella sp. NPDC054772]
MTVTQYDRARLAGVIALSDAEGWPSLVTDTAEDFYASFEHRTLSGFRIYP